MGFECDEFNDVCSFHRLVDFALNPHAALEALIHQDKAMLQSGLNLGWELI